MEEETSAFAKRRDPGIFNRTHPAVEQRIEVLQKYVEESFAEAGSANPGTQSHVEILDQYYMILVYLCPFGIGL